MQAWTYAGRMPRRCSAATASSNRSSWLSVTSRSSSALARWVITPSSAIPFADASRSAASTKASVVNPRRLIPVSTLRWTGSGRRLSRAGPSTASSVRGVETTGVRWCLRTIRSWPGPKAASTTMGSEKPFSRSATASST